MTENMTRNKVPEDDLQEREDMNIQGEDSRLNWPMLSARFQDFSFFIELDMLDVTYLSIVTGCSKVVRRECCH